MYSCPITSAQYVCTSIFAVPPSGTIQSTKLNARIYQRLDLVRGWPLNFNKVLAPMQCLNEQLTLLNVSGPG